MRTISLAGLQAMLAEQTDYAFIAGAKISHPSYSDPALPFYCCANHKDLTLGGVLHTAIPFAITLAADVDDHVPVAKIKIDNIERTLVQALRTMTSPPDIELSIWRVAVDLSAVREIGPLPFTLTAVEFDAVSIDGTLSFSADWLNEAAVADLFSPKVAPGLF
jgi:hypothetical protein